MEPRPIQEEEIHAFIDGELDASRSTEIAEALGRDKILAARLAAFRADKSALAQAYAEIASTPLPQEWIDRIAQKSARRAPLRRNYWMAGAALATLIAATASWHYLSAPESGDRIVTEALAARNDRLGGEKVILASAIGPDARAQMLGAILGASAKIPDLSRMDFHLESVKTFARAVELDYRDGRNRLFTIYLRRPEGSERFDQFQRGDLRVCIWQDDALGAVMSGPISGAEMMRLAALAYAGLTA